MGEPWLSMHVGGASSAKVRVRGLADRQFGRVRRDQLTLLGVERGQIAQWGREGYLGLVLPTVFAVGHRAPSFDADLAAALLYAGPGAMLSYATAAWWWGLIEHPPLVIEVSTPRRCKSVPGVRVHDRRPAERIWHKSLPTTPIAQTVLDVASTFDEDRLREVLAELDYRRWLDLEALRRACGPGRPGSAGLRRALRRHEPRLAQTRSRLERAFVLLCERFGLPLAEINARLHGITVDALFRRQGVVVELDGSLNHGTWAQIKRDRGNELILRGHGLVVVRYTEDQIEFEPKLVSADLRATLTRAEAALQEDGIGSGRGGEP